MRYIRSRLLHVLRKKKNGAVESQCQQYVETSRHHRTGRKTTRRACKIVQAKGIEGLTIPFKTAQDSRKMYAVCFQANDK